MKKLYYMIAMSAAVLAGCAKNGENPWDGSLEDVRDIQDVTFAVTLPGEMQSRTVLGGEDGHRSVSWEEGDMVRVFYDGGHADGEVGTGDGSINVRVAESGTYAAVYPLLDGSASGNSLDIEIPSHQDGSFASANVMAALTNSSERLFRFRNAAGIISFEVRRDDLTKVTIRSNDGCPIAGLQTLTFDSEGNISAGAAHGGGGSAEISVELNGAGTYYAAVMMNADMKAGFGMRFYKGDEPLSGVLSTSPVTVSPDVVRHVGCPELRISAGDYYIKEGGTGTGAGWNNPGGEDLLSSLLGGSQTDEVRMDGVTLGWRLHGKTIHIAAGQYNLGRNGQHAALKGISDISFSLKGGYPANVSGADSLPDAEKNETRLTVTSGSILELDGLTDADINIDGISFCGGNSKTAGGAVSCGITGSLRFSGCTFRECRTDMCGGAVNVTSGNVHFSNCVFDRNEAGDMDLIKKTGSSWDGWKAEYCGGGLCASGTDSHIFFNLCTFRNNRAHTTADIYLMSGASAYVNRCIFYGSTSGQYKNETYYYASSVTAEEGADRIQSLICINNSTFSECSSNYTSGLPTVNALSSRAMVINTTIINKGVNLILCRTKKTEAAELYAFNNLLLNMDGLPSINLNPPYAKNGYMNVIFDAKNNWILDGNDIRFGWQDFSIDGWDWNKGYYTWTLNEGRQWPEDMAVQSVLADKAAAAMPDFDRWLHEMESDPYGTDQSGAPRNPLRMTPGSWECDNL